MYNVEARQSACPSSLTMGEAGWPDHGFNSVSDHMRGRRPAPALVLAWCVLLLVTLILELWHMRKQLTCTAFTVLLLDCHHHQRNLIIYRELLQPAINPLHNEQINSAPALA